MIEMLFNRRSVRLYTDAPVEKQKVEVLVQALLLAPSSRSIRPWEFIIVDDEGILKKLSRAKKHGSSFLKNAPLGIVVTADKTKSDVWIEDASIATVMVQLAAESMGLGSCWIQIRERMHDGNTTSENYVRSVLGIPDEYAVESMVGIGYPEEQKNGYREADLHFEKVHHNIYSRPYR
jgi:nitroreductase